MLLLVDGGKLRNCCMGGKSKGVVRGWRTLVETEGRKWRREGREKVVLLLVKVCGRGVFQSGEARFVLSDEVFVLSLQLRDDEQYLVHKIGAQVAFWSEVCSYSMSAVVLRKYYNV